MEEYGRDTIYYSTENLSENYFDLKENVDVFENNENWTRYKQKEEEPSVDFVLVYKTDETDCHKNKRECYEENLREVGLILSTEQIENRIYVKIFAPRDVLCQYCEIMKIRMPMRNIPGLNLKRKSSQSKIKRIVGNFIPRSLRNNEIKNKSKWSAEFSTDKNYLFDVDSEDFFSSSVKCAIVNFILERGKFSTEPQDVGLGKLLSENVYKSAYPLHDGTTGEIGTKRAFFLKEWASLKKLFKFQPLDEIKNYFGIKFTLYFTWLGFYTVMLIPAAVIGILCMLYGWLTLSSNSLSRDICDPNNNITMCPLCDKYCDYWNIIEACNYAKVTYMFDNFGTIIFAMLMSIWSALYVECWKRYSAEISHRWGLAGFDLDAQHPRPEYLARLTKAKRKLNYVTNQEEPTVPFFRVKLPTMVLSFSFAILWVFLAIAAVFGIVIYRMTGIAADILFEESNRFTSFAIPITAGIINLVCISLLNFIYERLAVMLTEYEYHRTQLEFDDSLTLKIYMFQFVNFYSSLFYLAFLKGKFVGSPQKYNRIFRFRQEECSLGGCMMELFMQLAIVMIGKQAINAFVEYGWPLVSSLVSKGNVKKEKNEDQDCDKQWVQDFYLQKWDSKGMFSEYLEMVIQYGFVTIFVTAFPLAPLFALINNIFEMRLDAQKFVKYYRKPVCERVKSIGVWFHIIEAIGKISVVSNAFIIAFSSNFIPMLVYAAQNLDRREDGFLNFSLAYFDVNDFEKDSMPLNTKYNVTVCRYADFRNPYWIPEKYERNSIYWNILAARLAFVVVYQNFVGFLIMFIQWAIPDVPKQIKDKIKREALRTTEYIIQQEKIRAKHRRASISGSIATSDKTLS